METLSEAVANRRPIKVHASEATSVAALVPVKRNHDSVSLGLDDKRYLRIAKTGKTDLNGGRGGPWTEFNVRPQDDGALFFQGVKSGLWLTVTDGEFASSEEPVPLLLEFSTIAEEPATAQVDSVQVRLHLADGSAALPWPVHLCQKTKGKGKDGSGHVLLVTDGGNVACGPEANFHKKGQEGKWAQWVVEQAPGGASFKNVGHGRYLTLGAKGAPELADAPTLFSMTTVEGSAAPAIGEAMLPIDASVLSSADLAHFKEKGYIILRNAVPPELIRSALRSINHQLGRPDCWEVDKDPLNNNAAQLSLKLPRQGVGRDIFNKSPVFWSAVNVLLGAGNVAPWNQGQQVALRFPLPPGVGQDVPDIRPGTRYHIDGMGQNKLCPFSLLCGVALSEQMRTNMGNLHVFPGSHLDERLHKYYVDLINDDNQNETDDRKPNLGDSEQVLLRPGDVVLAHQLLAHRVGLNSSEHIRYQLYYRVSHKDHALLKPRIVEEPWVEFAV